METDFREEEDWGRKAEVSSRMEVVVLAAGRGGSC